MAVPRRNSKHSPGKAAGAGIRLHYCPRNLHFGSASSLFSNCVSAVTGAHRGWWQDAPFLLQLEALRASAKARKKRRAGPGPRNTFKQVKGSVLGSPLKRCQVVFNRASCQVCGARGTGSKARLCTNGKFSSGTGLALSQGQRPTP